ncbi:VOC family protein [Enhydrobacter sp.]|uniref:VOC family protein n=1 Tax=Enhydrobacter sp. TaxID=1894999 RepID=UPI002612124F|nr:VOC family protein [Enhydrobacter sp.]WIM14303.1 MAG: biphenyl-2,3-diol 1,2-dioxygenase III-related protein [Enhydrobacter sp.]
MPITIDRVDHIVLNCRDVETTVAWYQRVLGMTREEFGDYRHTALKFGRQKFNVRPSGKKDWWSVENDGPGALDLCFITRQRPDEVMAHLEACGVKIERGPSQQIGALGPMTSVYCYDPDGNLVEIASYPDGA